MAAEMPPPFCLVCGYHHERRAVWRRAPRRLRFRRETCKFKPSKAR